LPGASRSRCAELGARLAQADRDLERVRRLVDARAATTEELERSLAAAEALTAARDAAWARLDEARRLVAESTLRAPFAGTVTAVAVEPGGWVAPGRTVVEVAGDGDFEVPIRAPESVHRRISPGQPVEVELPFAGLTVPGRIDKVAAAAGVGLLFPVEVTLDSHPALTAGLTAEVVLWLRSGHELTVPLRAVVNPGSTSPSVFRVNDGVADEVPVELGRVRGDRIALTAELAPDDLVAVAGHTALADGDVVEVRR